MAEDFCRTKGTPVRRTARQGDRVYRDNTGRRFVARLRGGPAHAQVSIISSGIITRATVVSSAHSRNTDTYKIEKDDDLPTSFQIEIPKSSE